MLQKMNFGKIIIRIIFFLFLEIGIGLSLSFLYSIFVVNIFDIFFITHKQLNELIIYFVTLLLPFLLFFIRGAILFRKKDFMGSISSYIASFLYLIGGLLFLLIYTDFYILKSGV